MSNLIPRDFINELLTRCDLVDIIDSRVPLKKKGSNYAACCPFHNEKTPSFTVSPSKQIYHCFGCQVSGNALGFLMSYDRLTFVEAVEELAKQFGLTLPTMVVKESNQEKDNIYGVLEKASLYYQKQLKQSPVAINYLKARGLTGQIAKQFGIGYAPNGWDGLLKSINAEKDLLEAGLIIKKKEGGYYDRFRNRIMFPIRDRRGRVIAFGGRVLADEQPKYLNSPETKIFHKGNELYGLFEATTTTRKDLPRIIVVEGYMDVISMAQFGLTNAVATLGTATSTEHMQRLFRLTNEVVFCFDGDEAGQAAAWRALETVLTVLQDGWQIRFLIVPQEEDPDSLVRKEGVDGFNQRIEKALSLADFLFQSLVKKINVSTVEGKAQLAKNATPLLNQIPETVYKKVLFEKLSNLIHVDQETLQKLSSQKMNALKSKSNKNFNNRLKTHAKKTTRRSAMRLAIALLIQNPNLVQSLKSPDEIAELQIPGIELLKELIAQTKQTTDLNTGQLLEHWRDRAEAKQIEQLAVWDTTIPASGVEAEFLAVISKLIKENRQQRSEELMQKARLEMLSDTEKLELQHLIAVK